MALLKFKVLPSSFVDVWWQHYWIIMKPSAHQSLIFKYISILPSGFQHGGILIILFCFVIQFPQYYSHSILLSQLWGWLFTEKTTYFFLFYRESVIMQLTMNITNSFFHKSCTTFLAMFSGCHFSSPLLTSAISKKSGCSFIH